MILQPTIYGKTGLARRSNDQTTFFVCCIKFAIPLHCESDMDKNDFYVVMRMSHGKEQS